ncbi:hypothetical protein OPIT5_25375 [Opitutaceae bacterium TAV5]|nr:hypothetical protein OPIT5_25375 [Opitutaceae bacterium TAV5]
MGATASPPPDARQRAFRSCGIAPSVARRAPARVGPAGGFTLIEILLVIMLMALVTSVMITGSNALFNSSQNEDPEEAMLSLLQKVRMQAVEDSTPLDLVTVDEGQTWFYGDNHEMTMPVVDGVKVGLIKAEGANAILLGGIMEETPVTTLRFYPDGTCDPVRVQIQRGRERRVLVIDPWTCAALPETSGAR